MRGNCDCTGFCTDSALPLSPHRERLPAQIRQPQKELLHRIGLRVNITHSRLDVIVPRDVLQRKGIGVPIRLGEKRVPQSVQPASEWVLILVRSAPICVSSTQAPKGSLGSLG